MVSLTGINMDDAKELGEGFKLVPPDEYKVFIDNTEWKDAKSKLAGTNQNEFLECRLVVADGDFEGSSVLVRLNLRNENPTAVEIAKSQFRALCEATLGQPAPLNNDSASLHSRPFYAYIDNVEMKNSTTGARSNEVLFRKGSIRPLSSGPKAHVVKTQAPAAEPKNVGQIINNPMPATSAGTPPWKKK